MPPGSSLRTRREGLLGERGLTGSEWCRRYAATCDGWLSGLFAAAVAHDDDRRPGAGIALVAVGGYGAGELAPGSDLDLVLVHDRKAAPRAVADALWYPVWDEGVTLDHSVRSAKEVKAAMAADRKVALGWLQARVLAGDAEVGAAAAERALELWRAKAERWLPEVAEAVARRHEAAGDLAFLLEPDIKEARGGIRDLRVLRAVVRVAPVLGAVLDQPGLIGAADVLAAARVELQRSTGKSSNRLLLQEQDVVAAALGYPDADDLMADVSASARAIAWASDDGWRRTLASLRRSRPGRDRKEREAPVETGVAVRAGEVVLAPGAVPALDPTLALRVAAASAESDLPISSATLDRLAAESPAPEGAWSPAMRAALVRILAAGRPGIHAVEALDRVGVWVRLLPEWSPVRNRPQRNAYHRFTVDRHLLEASANAAALVGRVARPDLLLLGALLHDIGKGRGGDHTQEGVALVGAIGPRLGLDGADTATLVALVRHHLLLPDVATRRDLADPRTCEAVAEAVGDVDTLGLLAALTEADSLATGPSAWGHWKSGLVDTLVHRTGEHLAGRPVAAEPRDLTHDERALVATGTLGLVVDDHRVTVAAPDRTGLLSVVAGVLALDGVTVRSAWTRTETGSHMAVLVFDVVPTFDVLPPWGRVQRHIEAALEGRLPLAERLDERERSYAGRQPPVAATAPSVRIETDNSAATAATVVEVRAPDSGPVLYRITAALTGIGVSIDAALVTTIGAEAVDAFYLTTQAGDKLDEVTGERVVATLVDALA